MSVGPPPMASGGEREPVSSAEVIARMYVRTNRALMDRDDTITELRRLLHAVYELDPSLFHRACDSLGWPPQTTIPDEVMEALTGRTRTGP